MPSPQPLDAAAEEDGAVRLPAHGTTVTAEDLRVGLVLAADRSEELVVDASDVESVGQAVLQLLIAARREAAERGQRFVIANPSSAFSQRIAACGPTDLLGLEHEEVSFQ